MTNFPLVCPVCGEPLSHPDNDPKRLTCDANHSFDRAKQGYWNLLLAQNKRSKSPGDSKDMLLARRAFLDKGHYQAISDALSQTLITQLSNRNDANPALIADIGCGEGYYSHRLHQALKTANIDHGILAVDIAKDAARLASAKYKDPELLWMVASGARLPLEPHSLDLITVMFNRLMPEPLAEALKPTGELIAVWPAQRHLIELREHIYDTVRDTELDATQVLTKYFDEVAISQVNETMTLTEQSDLDQLLLMTPHGQRAQEHSQTLLSNGPFTLTISVNIGRYTPKT